MQNDAQRKTKQLINRWRNKLRQWDLKPENIAQSTDASEMIFISATQLLISVYYAHKIRLGNKFRRSRFSSARRKINKKAELSQGEPHDANTY